MQSPLTYVDTYALLVMFDMKLQAYKTSQKLQKGLYSAADLKWAHFKTTAV